MRKIFFILLGGLLIVGVYAPPAACTRSFGRDYFMYGEYAKTISMDFKDASLKDVLKIFSQQSGLNFIAAEPVADKKITLYLDGVPVEEALERILDANDLMHAIRPDSNIFIVRPVARPDIDLITRVYQLKHATVQSSKLRKTLSIGESGGETGGGSSGGGMEGPAQTGGGIVAAIQMVLSSSGKIVEDPRTNSIVVTDLPFQFPVIEKTIARLDVPVPQVLIEVEMLDVSKTLADQMGIKPGQTPLTFVGGTRQHYYPWDTNKLVGKGQTAPTYSVGTIDASGLTAALEFLRTNTDTKNLARPRILTLNNETAQIKILTDEAIGITTQQTGGTEVVPTASTEAERVETGVILTVTPQVNLATNEIIMAIAPKVIEARVGGTFQGVTFKDPEERGSQSILRVHNGDTIMIGGLLRNDYAATVTKLPVLGNIPILGAAFRHRDKSKRDRELIIFITPHIVSDALPGEIALQRPQPIIREQDMPRARSQAVYRELLKIERQRN